MRALGNIALFLVEYYHKFKSKRSLFPKKLSCVSFDAQTTEKERKQHFNKNVKNSVIVDGIRKCVMKGLEQRNIKFDNQFFMSALEDVDQIMAYLSKNSNLKEEADLSMRFMFRNLFMDCPEFTQADPGLLKHPCKKSSSFSIGK